jgi:hypothetical protein
MRQVPDPEREEWIARMRERARLDADALVPRPPFDVYGLDAPPLRPVALGELVRSDDEWETIGVTYGDWAAPAGPWAAVTSSIGYAPEPETALFRAIDAEHARIASEAGADEEEPAGPPAYAPAEITVGGGTVSALAGRHGNVQAARLAVGPVTVTVVSRGVDLDQVRLAAVTDLEPYSRGRSEMIAQAIERHRNQPPPVLEPAEGMAAYRALVDASIDQHARLLATLRAGRTPRHRAEEGPVMGALWQRAVRELSDRAGIGKRAADDIITSVVNQLTNLGDEAPWFTGDARLRERAIDETLRHAVLDEDVPSRPAQQAWSRYWATQMSLAGMSPADRAQAGPAELVPRSSDWLAAWAAWASQS